VVKAEESEEGVLFGDPLTSSALTAPISAYEPSFVAAVSVTTVPDMLHVPLQV